MNNKKQNKRKYIKNIKKEKKIERIYEDAIK